MSDDSDDPDKPDNPDNPDNPDPKAAHAKMKEASEKMADDHPELEVEAQNAQNAGQLLADSIIINAQINGMSTAAVVYACAMVFAMMLTNADGRMTEWEAEGHGLLGDEERIHFFCDDVREYARQIREHRANQAKDEATKAKDEGRAPNVGSASAKQVH